MPPGTQVEVPSYLSGLWPHCIPLRKTRRQSIARSQRTTQCARHLAGYQRANPAAASGCECTTDRGTVQVPVQHRYFSPAWVNFLKFSMATAPFLHNSPPPGFGLYDEFSLGSCLGHFQQFLVLTAHSSYKVPIHLVTVKQYRCIHRIQVLHTCWTELPPSFALTRIRS